VFGIEILYQLVWPKACFANAKAPLNLLKKILNGVPGDCGGNAIGREPTERHSNITILTLL